MASHPQNGDNLKEDQQNISTPITPVAAPVLFPSSSSHSMLENVHAAPIPAPNPSGTHSLQPRCVYLKDHVTQATIYPVASAAQLSTGILQVLQNEINSEIRRGNTYPMEEEMDFEQFVGYWFGTFAAVMIQGKPEEHGDLAAERDWSQLVLGTFYIKPNYPGRSSHICNGGFLTSAASRGKGCGRLLGESYLEYAPKLGFTYSVFNLVYENNTASCKIWDSLGFKKIGVVRGAGRLQSCSLILVDAIIYGRDLKDDDDYVSEERFDKIRFYLEKGKYPPSADRSEKSRLRSAATHYRIADGKLMLKDKEVVSDSQLQYEIARSVHAQSHGGINKTTAHIAEKYHWVRIKETVSQVIRNCPECKEHPKPPVARAENRTPPKRSSPPKQVPVPVQQQPSQQHIQQPPQQHHSQQQQAHHQQQQQQQQQHHHQHHHQHQKVQAQVQQAQLFLERQALAQQMQQQQAQQLALQVPASVSVPLVPQSAPLMPLDVSRAAALAGMNIPVDPQMMEGVEHATAHAQFVQQMQVYTAPVAPMHPAAHHMAVAAAAADHANRLQQQQHAVEAARAALSAGGEVLTDGMNKDRHLLESLTAELKRKGGDYDDDDEEEEEGEEEEEEEEV